MRSQALSLCKFSRLGDRPDLSATSIETLRSMVALGSGVTLIPKLAIRRETHVRYIPFSDSSPCRTIGIIYRPSYAEPGAVAKLGQILESIAEKEKLILPRQSLFPKLPPEE